MNRRRALTGLLLAATLAAGAADQSQAQNRYSIQSPFVVRLENYVVLAGGGPVGEERIVGRDTVVMRTGIGYGAGASPARSLSITLADLPIAIPAESLMLEASARGDTRLTIGEGARIFCGRPQPTRGIRPPAGRRGNGRRFEDEVRPCLIDRDDDRSFDAAILVGARWPADRLVVPIEPLPYAPLTAIPMPDSELTVTFLHDSPVQGWVLRLGGRLLGRPFTLTSIKLQPPGGTRQGFGSLRGVGARAYPHVIDYGAARISILGYDSQAHTARLRVDHGFETASAELNFFSNTTVITIYR